MKDINFYVLNSGTIIRKDILAVTIEYDTVTGNIFCYNVIFAGTPNTVIITKDDYLDLRERLC